MDLGLYEILKNLSKQYPNDMEFGSKVRIILKEMNGEVNTDLLSTLVGKQEMETLKEKLEPTKDELSKLEEFLSNLKTNEDGI
jgi:hypothetical protein